MSVGDKPGIKSILGFKKRTDLGAPWWLKSVKHPTFGFGSGHDFTVCEFELPIRPCADSVKSSWDSLSLPLPACSLFLKVNK